MRSEIPSFSLTGLTGPKEELYEVRFLQRDLWDDYAGPDKDTVDLDLYRHWLEKI